MAAIDDNTPNLFLYKKITAGQYGLNQTIECGVRLSTVSWANNGNRLLVGALSSGDVRVFAFNSTTQQFYLKQTLSTSHSGGVAKISGRTSRFVSCGTTDSNINVWYFNITTGNYNTAVNSTTTVASCTAVNMVSTEQKIAVGLGNGTVVILERNQEFLYTTNITIPAHLTSVNFVRWTSDGVYLLT